MRAAIAISVSAIATIFLGAANAQIVPDSSLPQNSIVSPNGTGLQIDGGTTAGTNLFHSFSEFSVPAGAEALFNNAPAIDNIFTRVTGDRISTIDGRIRANGMANLFLLNPNGIAFGNNARLDIGGSFFGTTARSIVFENGVEFGAAASAGQPLLVVNVPVGLQFDERAAEIRVRGEGHDLAIANPLSSPIFRSDSRSGLQVSPGRTLALVGGDVLLEGGTLTAEGGRIELGGVEAGFVGLMAPLSPEIGAWHFNYDGISRFRDVRLSQQAAADASGIGVGSIQIVGRQIALEDGSIALLQNQGTQSFGPLRVRASESVAIARTTPDRPVAAGFRQETLGAGNAGDVEISSPRLALREGGQIFNRTQAEGNAGAIDIRAAESIEIVGRSPLNSAVGSLIGSTTLGMGSGGNIEIATGNLSVRGGAVLASSTSGAGSSGNILANVTETIETIGVDPQIGSPSVISSTSFSVGNAGSVTLNASGAIVREGGQIGSVAVSSGASGRIFLNATEFVEVSGTAPGSGLPSQINASTNRPAARFQQAFGLAPVPSGVSGSVEINTPQLNVIDGGTVTARNEGTGRAGDLQVNAEVVLLDGGGSLIASTQSGTGGNIQLSLDDSLQLSDSSFISAEAGGTGNGGNVTIDTGAIALIENSRIAANAFEGNGGNIAIATQGIFASPESSITASSQFGIDGVVEITNPEIDTDAGLVELSDRVADPTERVATECSADEGSSFTHAGRGGLPDDPIQPLRDRALWQDRNDYSQSIATKPAQLDPAAEETVVSPLIEATTWQIASDGTVALLAEVARSPDWESPTSCGSHVSQR